MNHEILKAITPKSQAYSEKFSYNLAHYLRGKIRTLHALGFYFAPEVSHPAWDDAVTCPHMIFVGTEDDGWIHGARLSEILCQGKKANDWAFPPRNFPLGLRNVTDRIIQRYLEIGRCALDPQHTLYPAQDRFTQTGDTRVCRLCGRVETRHETPRLVIDVDWRLSFPIIA